MTRSLAATWPLIPALIVALAPGAGSCGSAPATHSGSDRTPAQVQRDGPAAEPEPEPEVVTPLPEVPPHAVLRPTFETSAGEHSAGAAFVVRWPQGPALLLTAHHVFGAAGGFDREYGWNELRGLVQRVHAASVADPSVTIDSVVVIPMQGAHAASATRVSGDLAAFAVADTAGVGVLELAEDNPHPGDPVFLLGRTIRRARVADSGPRILSYEFVGAGPEPGEAIGAPVVDASGRVVAVHVSGFAMDGERIGVGNPVSAVRQLLTASVSGTGTGRHPGLYDPRLISLQAPDTFRVQFVTNKGAFTIEVVRSWAPRGADRLYSLIAVGFYDGTRFFRAIPRFMVQFGIHGDPEVNKAWRNATIADDPVTQSNLRGTVVFAKTGAPDSRTTQLYINYRDNPYLDRQGFAPVGTVVEGMEVVDSLETKYGEQASRSQMRIQAEGNAFLDEDFPDLDYIESATLVAQ